MLGASGATPATFRQKGRYSATSRIPLAAGPNCAISLFGLICPLIDLALPTFCRASVQPRFSRAGGPWAIRCRPPWGPSFTTTNKVDTFPTDTATADRQQLQPSCSQLTSPIRRFESLLADSCRQPITGAKFAIAETSRAWPGLRTSRGGGVVFTRESEQLPARFDGFHLQSLPQRVLDGPAARPQRFSCGPSEVEGALDHLAYSTRSLSYSSPCKLPQHSSCGTEYRIFSAWDMNRRCTAYLYLG